MWITLTFQNKGQKTTTTWEGTGGWFESLTPSEIVSSWWQFNENYEYVGWIATNMTEEEFNDLYEAGQRLFYLENEYYRITVVLHDGNYDKYEKIEEQKYKARLFDDLLIHSYNYSKGLIYDQEFGEMLSAYEDFQSNGDRNSLEGRIAAVEESYSDRLYEG